ncbi:hypothetical protein PHMEG_00023399 [Phytophthora megakarya]|uniref:Uncharacterized protein n=1 Tax=Phytophthora megakarya TaxID=4795 RepID=A0A225VGG8_9STRA|nr:hypothetical protein PHMEG_00023399 [Phytophthora megakarya]
MVGQRGGDQTVLRSYISKNAVTQRSSVITIDCNTNKVTQCGEANYGGQSPQTKLISRSTNATPGETHTKHGKTSSRKKKRKRQFSKLEIKEVERSLVELHADQHLPDRFVEQDSLLCPGVTDVLPSGRVLGGGIRKEHAVRRSKKDVQTLAAIQTDSGGRVNLLSDVWQNVSKVHLLGAQLVLFGVLLTYSLEPVGDRHDGIAIAQDLEKLLKRVLHEKWNVCGLVTNNAGQCGRATRILALRWPQIVFLFCFGPNVNNLVKAVVKTSFQDIAVNAATVVNIINGCSAKWLK